MLKFCLCLTTLLVATAVSSGAPTTRRTTDAQCQCEAGDYWCSADDNLRYTYNCSGTEASKALWKNISNSDEPSAASCQALTTTCDVSHGAHGVPAANQTCDDKCYDFCWFPSDVGDCADMDDEQIYCVGSCMDYCTKTHCSETPPRWSRCQTKCIKEHMQQPKDKINFVDYSTCMATCTSVPISPYGKTFN